GQLSGLGQIILTLPLGHPRERGTRLVLEHQTLHHRVQRGAGHLGLRDLLERIARFGTDAHRRRLLHFLHTSSMHQRIHVVCTGVVQWMTWTSPSRSPAPKPRPGHRKTHPTCDATYQPARSSRSPTPRSPSTPTARSSLPVPPHRKSPPTTPATASPATCPGTSPRSPATPATSPL